MGPYLVVNLHARGHRVAVCNRGQTEASLPAGIVRLRLSSANLADRAGWEGEVVEAWRGGRMTVLIGYSPKSFPATEVTATKYTKSPFGD